MADGVRDSRSCQGVRLGSHAVVVLAQVVRDVQRGHGAPGEEFLGHARVVDLVNDDVEVVDLSQRVHLKLTTPSSVLAHPIDVVIDVLVVFDEELV